MKRPIFCSKDILRFLDMNENRDIILVRTEVLKKFNITKLQFAACLGYWRFNTGK